MDTKTRKQLKQIAHHLAPVITVGEHGLSAGVLAETDRALADHELIKVRLQTADRQERAEVANELASRCDAAVVQKIGKIIVLFRVNPKPKRELSNLSRYGLSS